MTIQMLATWNGLEEDAVVTLASGAEETRLISLGLARNYTVGMDGRNPVLSNAQQAATQDLVSGAGTVACGTAIADAAANTAAINAALAAGECLVTGGLVYINDTLWMADGAKLVTDPNTTIIQAPNTNKLMLGNSALLAAAATVTVTWSSGRTASLAWTGHPLVAGDAVVLQGAAQADWWTVARVVSIADANNAAVLLAFSPTASPTGTVTAVRCNRNITVNARLDYNFTNNAAGGQPNYARMASAWGFIADSQIDVVSVSTNGGAYKYGVLLAGADNVTGSAVSFPTANSDTLKYYGPINNCRMRASGQAAEDCASAQMLEPAAFVAYMPCRGNIIGATIERVNAGATTAGSGPVVLYSDDTYYAERIVLDGGEMRGMGGTLPGLIVKPGTGFATASSRIRDLTVQDAVLSSVGGDDVTVQTKMRSLMLQRCTLVAPAAIGNRLVKVPNGGTVDTLTLADMSIDTGSWPSGAGYGVEVSSGGVANTIVFRNLVVRGSSSLRFFLAISGSTVKTVIFENCDFSGIDVVGRIEQAGITVIVRGGIYTSCLTLFNFRDDGTLILDGPLVTGATNGVCRTELAGTVVDVYGWANLTTPAQLAVGVTSGKANIKMPFMSLDPAASNAASFNYLTGAGLGASFMLSAATGPLAAGTAVKNQPLTFTASLTAATSGTLAATFTGTTGAYWVTFSDGSNRAVTLTNGATTATWTGAVTATATAGYLTAA